MLILILTAHTEINDQDFIYARSNQVRTVWIQRPTHHPLWTAHTDLTVLVFLLPLGPRRGSEASIHGGEPAGLQRSEALVPKAYDSNDSTPRGEERKLRGRIPTLI